MTWTDRAAEALTALIDTGEPFTADDLIARAGHPDYDHRPNARNNAVGPLFREAAKARRIVMVGTRNSTTPTRKGGLIRVWQRP